MMPASLTRPIRTVFDVLIQQGPVALLRRITDRFLPHLVVSRLRCLSQISWSAARRGETVVFRPVIRDAEELADVVARACWYLGGQHVREFRFYVADERLARATQFMVEPDAFDHRIRKLLPAFLARSRFIVERSDRAEPPAADASAVLFFDKNAAAAAESNGASAFLRRTGRSFCVDPQRERNEGANYTSAAHHLTRDRQRLQRVSAERFRALRARLGKYKTCNVIATGPSFSEWPKLGYQDALTVVCNSAVANEELMQNARPQILVFADPIFHFGPSEYAARFRASLRAAARRHDFAIIIPFKYMGIMITAMPELSDRVIGLPFETTETFNTNLDDAFRVRVTANVLTLLMLPIATTFADEVMLIGCDGRPMSESGYFWKHAKSAQFGAEMEGIRVTHKAFFDIDYNDYYSTHCELVARFVETAERRGKRIYTAAPSHIPALSVRERLPNSTGEIEVPATSVAAASPSTELPRVLVVDLTPILSDTATGQLKALFFSDYPSSRVMQIVRMRRCVGLIDGLQPDWAAHIRCPSFTRIHAAVAAFAPDVMYFRSTGDPILDRLAARLLAAWPMRLVTHVMDDWLSRLVLTAPECAQRAEARFWQLLSAADARLSISDDMSVYFAEKYGMAMRPMANAVPPGAIAARPRPAGSGCVIRYLGSLAADMNRQSVCEVARAVNALADPNIRVEIFTAKAWLETTRELIEESPVVSVLPTVATQDEYWQALRDADVLLLAYNFDEISRAYTQHSFANKLPECLASGAAILGYGPPENATLEFVRREAVGLVIQQHDPDGLSRAIRRLAEDPEYRRSLAEQALSLARRRFLQDDTVARFRAVLHGIDPDLVPPAFDHVSEGGRA